MLNFLKKHKALRNGKRRFPSISTGDKTLLMLKMIKSYKHSLSRGLSMRSRRVKTTKLWRNIRYEKHLIHDFMSRETEHRGPLSDRGEEFYLDSADEEQLCEGNLLESQSK